MIYLLFARQGDRGTTYLAPILLFISSYISQLSRTHIKQDAFSLSSLERNFEIVRPATKKALSEGADVAGMQRCLGAILPNVGDLSK